jgi:hypothetical protein
MDSFSPVAQSVEQVTVNHWVGGSSPSGGANIKTQGPLAGLVLFCADVDRSSAVDILFMIT